MKLLTIDVDNVNGIQASIDLASMPAGLVAFTGSNGAGKTTALEAVPAALYGMMPSRRRGASLYDYVAGDGGVRLTFEADGGAVIGVRVRLDGDRRKAEGWLETDGVVLTTGKIADLRGSIEELFGSRDLFLAGAFAAQNRRGNLAELTKGERKALFVEMLGIAGLQAIADVAREHGRQAEAERAAMNAERDALEGRRSVESAEAEVATWENTVAEADEERDEATLRVARAVDALEGIAGAIRERDRTAQARSQAQADAERNEEEIRRGETTRARVLDDWRELEEQHEADARKFDQEADHLERSRQADIDRATRRVQELEVEGTEPAWAELEEDLDQVLEGLGVLDREAQAHEAIVAKHNECVRRAELRYKVPCTATDRWIDYDGDLKHSDILDLAGTCPLLADANEARAASSELSIERAKYEASAEEREAKRRVLQARQAELVELFRGRPRWDAYNAARDRLEGDLAEIDGRAQAAREALARRRTDHGKRLEQRKAKRDRDLVEIQTRLEKLRHDNEELAAVLRKATEEARQAAEALEALGDVEDLERDKRAGAADVEAAQNKRAQARERLGQAKARLEEARVVERRWNDLTTAARGVTEAMGQWAKLATAFGPDGVQALLIDAAGPEIAAIVNELLEACYGPRFSIAFRTLRPRARGAGHVEEFSIRVFDEGAERDLEDLSGGERTIVGEALALGLAIYNARRAGIQWRTLFRDETAGALDPDNAHRYVEMLRRAREVGGFHQVVFVAHLPQVVDAADVRVRFHAGTARRIA
jgi:exonuclease SbcC